MTAMFRSHYSDAADMIKRTHEALIAMQPNNIHEGMLCSRILALNNHAMACLKNAASPDQTSAGVDINYNRATKLMRLANDTLETLNRYRLNRYRRKGEQKVTVQHVQVIMVVKQ
ncbi:hypothetical protein HRU45_04730 [Candidatus Dependentiae bacterium]|nr:hypothetical protein [Candidatus Dependentiae bacterium]